MSPQQDSDQDPDQYRRRQILEAVNEAYASLLSDAVAWAELCDELSAWDCTLSDGLEDWDESLSSRNQMDSRFRGNDG